MTRFNQFLDEMTSDQFFNFTVVMSLVVFVSVLAVLVALSL